MNIITILKKYRHGWVFLYAFIYMPWFIYLERHITSDYYVIHSRLDDYIPFIEYFIVPYTLWFAYIGITMLYFFLTNRQDFYRLIMFLFSGMTLFLVISTIFPNGLQLRPEVFARDNMFVDMVKTLYSTDTPTNVLPSIHAFNSIGAQIAIMHSEALKKYKIIQYGSLLLSTLIILSTMFLKQHSIIDVAAAGLMGIVLYQLIYSRKVRPEYDLSHQTTQ